MLRVLFGIIIETPFATGGLLVGLISYLGISPLHIANMLYTLSILPFDLEQKSKGSHCFRYKYYQLSQVYEIGIDEMCQHFYY